MSVSDQSLAKYQSSTIAPKRWASFGSMLKQSMSAHDIYFAYTAVYTAFAVWVWASFDVIRDKAISGLSLSFLTGMLPVLAVAIITLRFVNLALFVRPARPTLALIHDVRHFVTDASRLTHALPITVALLIFIKTFVFFKANIPNIVPFSWDTTFSKWDAAFHFNQYPWIWLHSIFGYAPVTFIINVGYNLWFMVMWIMWVLFAFQAQSSALRTRFFISFVLIWSIGGSLAAIGFSSAGPAYFDDLNLSPNPYADLMAYLYAVNEWLPLWALNTQEILWLGYLGKQDIVVGISAMPSMHNASSLLFALAGWQLNRKLGIILSVYAAVIFVGSIHLGWHYAIDAYAAFALTLPIWWLAKPIASWHENRRNVRAFAMACEQHQNSQSYG